MISSFSLKYSEEAYACPVYTLYTKMKVRATSILCKFHRTQNRIVTLEKY